MPSPDIVVIGAGVIGCAVAHECARRGASVDVVDDRAPGMGATQASAGMLAPWLEASSGPLLDLSVRSLKAWDAFVPRVSSDSGAAFGYHRTGTLSVALDDATFDSLAAVAETLKAQDIDRELLDAGSVQVCEPALSVDVRGGLLIPSHGSVNAHELTRTLAAAARHHGARILEHGRVRCVTRTGGEFSVVTEHGPLTADIVVVAAGSWAGAIDLDGTERVPVHPVRGQLLRLGWHGDPLARIVWGEACYIVPWTDGTLLVGATVEDVGFDERNTADGVLGLIEAATALVPHLAHAAFLSARAGLRPGTPDDLPIIGPSPSVPGLWYATGHYRSGVLMAPLTATLIADAVLEGKVDPILSATAPHRFVRSLEAQ